MSEYVELDSELLLLAAEGGDYNRREAIARIQDMKRDEREILREALVRLDEWLDEVIIEERLERERRRTR